MVLWVTYAWSWIMTVLWISIFHLILCFQKSMEFTLHWSISFSLVITTQWRAFSRSRLHSICWYMSHFKLMCFYSQQICPDLSSSTSCIWTCPVPFFAADKRMLKHAMGNSSPSGAWLSLFALMQMRTATMCFSISQFSRGVPRIAGLWGERFHNLYLSSKNNSNFRVPGSKTYVLECGYSKRWICRPVSSKEGGRRKTTDANKSTDISNKVLEETVSATATVNVNRTEVTEFRKIEYCDIQQKIAHNKELASLVTTIVFDIETTGFSRVNERIIEIAFRDLSGGENSTFQSLVNPQRYVVNAHVHGIRTHMVNRPDVPRYSMHFCYYFHVPFCLCAEWVGICVLLNHVSLLVDIL